MDKYLLSKGVDFNHEDSYGWGPLHYALYSQDAERVRLYIEAGVSFVMLYDRISISPLHFLCYNASYNDSILSVQQADEKEEHVVECINLLTEAGHGVPLRDTLNTECTPLHHAAESGQTRVIDSLISCGWSMDQYAYYDKCCQFGRKWKPLPTVLDTLSNGAWNPLKVAVWAGQLDVVIKLLDLGAGKERHLLGRLLDRACFREPDSINYVEMAQLLIEHGFSVKYSSLELAAYQVSQDMTRILLSKVPRLGYNDRGLVACVCSARCDNQSRKQPLAPAFFQREREAVLELLLEAGALLNTFGRPAPPVGPLHYASGCRFAHLPWFSRVGREHNEQRLSPDQDLCRYLLTRGADPLQDDEHGLTAPLAEIGLSGELSEYMCKKNNLRSKRLEGSG